MLFKAKTTSSKTTPRPAATEPSEIRPSTTVDQSIAPAWAKDTSQDGLAGREDHWRCRAERRAADTDRPQAYALAVAKLMGHEPGEGPSGEELSKRQRRPQHRPVQVALDPRNRRSVHHA